MRIERGLHCSYHASEDAQSIETRPRGHRRLGRALAIGFTAGLLVFGSSAGVAYAAASSGLDNWRTAGRDCFHQQATTQNSAAVGKSGNGINYVNFNSLSGCNNSEARTADIGIAAFLKTTSGAACATSGAAYVHAQSITRYAWYDAGACGSGVNLQGTITSYAYNGSGYSSSSIAAPFQGF